MFDRMVVSLEKNSKPVLEKKKKKLWQGSKFKPDFPLHWKMYEFILIFFYSVKCVIGVILFNIYLKKKKI